jgi:hypothetical protein
MLAPSLANGGVVEHYTLMGTSERITSRRLLSRGLWLTQEKNITSIGGNISLRFRYGPRMCSVRGMRNSAFVPNRLHLDHVIG